jgi:hypothetical protein
VGSGTECQGWTSGCGVTASLLPVVPATGIMRVQTHGVAEWFPILSREPVEVVAE